MTITKKIDGNFEIIAIDGWLDTVTALDLEKEIVSIEPEIKHLTLDFEKLEYISSAGLRQIVLAHKLMKDGEMRIINVSDEVMEVFKMTGLSKKLNIEQN